MVWTEDRINRLPEIYRDFMLTLRPVVDREPSRIFQVHAVHFGLIVDLVGQRHPLGWKEIRQVADNLRQQNYIHEDELGVITPTEKGAELVRALSKQTARLGAEFVPPLPNFQEN